MTSVISLNLEERYKELTTNHPNIIQRLPQHMIASYMGLTPETLSPRSKKNFNAQIDAIKKTLDNSQWFFLSIRIGQGHFAGVALHYQFLFIPF